MPYEILDEITRADIAFRISGNDLDELFFSGAQALLSIMVDNPESISPKIERNLELNNSAIDMLLYNFLNELIFIKDAESLILLPKTISIINSENVYLLKSIFNGEYIDNSKHELNVDVKAVTMHNLSANKIQNGWEAVFVLDL
jgi:SHS2 domain-containing protein